MGGVASAEGENPARDEEAEGLGTGAGRGYLEQGARHRGVEGGAGGETLLMEADRAAGHAGGRVTGRRSRAGWRRRAEGL
jgi:hypothetical protein